MHLLSATPGTIDDGSQAVDLGQTPADVVILSAADSELTCLALAHRRLMTDEAMGTSGPLSLRLASLLHLSHPLSVDLYLESVVQHARLVVVRLLGGRSYWPYGVDELAALCRQRGIALALLPGEDLVDEELRRTSLEVARTSKQPTAIQRRLDAQALDRLQGYLTQGGLDNAEQALRYLRWLVSEEESRLLDWQEPRPLPAAGVWEEASASQHPPDAPVAALVFYRALVQGANTAVIAALCAALRAEGLRPLPLYVTSLKDPVAAELLEQRLAEERPAVILNATAFAVATPSGDPRTPFTASDCPVLQVVFAGSDRAAWEDGAQGLSPRDLAMNVALPEVDGRILSRAVSFKAASERNPATESDLVVYQPVADRVAFVAQMAAGWARLRQKPAAQRRLGMVLANYPNRAGRVGNGVGLDTPASAVHILQRLADEGYGVEAVPSSSAALMVALGAVPSLSSPSPELPPAPVFWSGDAYRAFFARLPAATQQAVRDRWGDPADDPAYDRAQDGFFLRVLLCGTVAVGIQPPRCRSEDPLASYHDLTVAPPHGYLAFYGWLRFGFAVDALIHLGKHGTLEWLPGKALALSAACFPEALLGPLPHLYPFIVNDPGEGTQAKRRAQAVIVDHLTPPLTRADSYGPLKDLEALVDEYYEAAGVDRRRLAILQREILDLARQIGLDRDVGITDHDDEQQALMKLDNHLCELKELQIRDGLHVFGQTPPPDLAQDLLLALARVPGAGSPSLHRALAEDLALGFDPLTVTALGEAWDGPRPDCLEKISPALSLAPSLAPSGVSGVWRSLGDTVERLEALAHRLIVGSAVADPRWSATATALAFVEQTLRPAVERCGEAEMEGLLRGLAGRFVPPAPSGAPTRGRPDVLPTGRNFYSVDTRVIPTPAAWALGWASAQRLLDRHAQDHGDWPQALALTAWGTANMRTGGDDLAQALALIGVKPTWDKASRRVTGFEVLPLTVLDRPRVDVTLRISGFFRDAFPAQIDLFDSAVQAVAALDEPAEQNPLAAAVRQRAAVLQAQGLSAEQAHRQASRRVFGAQAGAYGSGLQGLLDERRWQDTADLARAYTDWSSFAYGGGAQGVAAGDDFRQRLAQVQVVVQNQDNREHDLLDSDEYAQFAGGLAAAVRQASGQAPEVYYNDHARPHDPRIRSLREEIARVVRGRATNPKWIAGVMRHGYKGAVELAATVDYLLAFQATAGCVEHHQFEAVFDAYLRDDRVLDFLQTANPAALRELAETFQQAVQRGLWVPRRNSVYAVLEELLRGTVE